MVGVAKDPIQTHADANWQMQTHVVEHYLCGTIPYWARTYFGVIS